MNTAHRSEPHQIIIRLVGEATTIGGRPLVLKHTKTLSHYFIRGSHLVAKFLWSRVSP